MGWHHSSEEVAGSSVTTDSGAFEQTVHENRVAVK